MNPAKMYCLSVLLWWIALFECLKLLFVLASAIKNKKKEEKKVLNFSCFDFNYWEEMSPHVLPNYLWNYGVLKPERLVKAWMDKWHCTRAEMYLHSVFQHVCVSVCVCLTIDRPAIGCCSHMSKKGWTMYPWCSTCLWTSRSWSLSLVSELPLSGSQVRTLLCQYRYCKWKPCLVMHLEVNCCLIHFFLITN